MDDYRIGKKGNTAQQMSQYTAKSFPFRNSEGRVALVIEIEKERYTKLPFENTPPN